MIVTGIEVQGLRGARGVALGPDERLVSLPAAPEGTAIADALDLFSGALSEDRLLHVLDAIGIAGGPADVLSDQGLPTEASWPDGLGVPPLLAPDADRRVVVEVTVAPDPPLFGDLRVQSTRDPRLVTALGQSPELSVRVGWLFTPDHTVASLSVLGLRVGEVGFPVVGKERPAWLAGLAREVAGRFGRVRWQEPLQRVTDRLLAASLSADPAVRRRFRAAAEALAAPPFSLGRLELVHRGDRVEPRFLMDPAGDDLLRLRQLGPRADTALRLVEAAVVQAPDVLVVEAHGASEPVISWLEERTRGHDATLEQVMVVSDREGGDR